jgi:prepilin-type N-terminal cleavage/methylation domain-containing protein
MLQASSENRAFTLVELLVVITIIVVLIALLAPALDQAIYQAQLTVCSAHQRSVATGAVNYALDFQRNYPYRPAVYDVEQNTPSNWQAVSLHQSAIYLGTEYDDRPTIKDYIGINGLLNDPLAAPVDLVNSDRLGATLANVSMWFGYKYSRSSGMLKIGNRLGYGNDKYRFNILVSDRDVVAPGAGEAQASHPDKHGIMYNRPLQDAEHPWLGGNQGIGAASGQGIKLTLSFWLSFEVTGGTFQRGPIDTNWTYQDLSVVRYIDVEWDSAQSQGDGRMVNIRTFNTEGRGGPHHMPAVGG